MPALIPELFARPEESQASVTSKVTARLRKLGRATIRCARVGMFDDCFHQEIMETDEYPMTIANIIFMFDKQNKDWGIYKDEGVDF